MTAREQSDAVVTEVIVESVVVEATAGDDGRIHDDQLHVPEPGERQLTARAVITGCILGCVVASMNLYLGLKTGWSIGGSLIAAILGFAVWRVISAAGLGRGLSILETNIAQTSGSAAGSMASAAGLLSAIPALGLMGVKLSYFELVAWAMSVGFLGVFYAVPLRNQIVVVENLRFPTGTATAETIMSMFAHGADALRQARWLLAFGIVAAVFTFCTWLIPGIDHPSLAGIEGALRSDVPQESLWLAIGAMWGFSLLISPLMTGAGLLIGPRIGSSLLIGAIAGWAILGPIAQSNGWAPGAVMSYADGPRGWLLWPGVAIMIADALTSLALSWRTVIATFRPSKAGSVKGLEPASMRIPTSWWLIGLGCGTILAMVTAQSVFGIPWWMTLIAVAMSSILAMIAVRSTGETDINPIGGMGKVTQLVFGGLAPGDAQTNLMAAGITSAGASQAGDMMQDLKTGRLLGATPRFQVIAQCIGIVAGIPVAVGAYWVFANAYDLGTDQQFPAPAAQAWKAMAELLAGGFDQLPPKAVPAVIVGALVGVLIPVLRKYVKPLAPYMPSALAMGIAFIVPAYYSIAMFIGSMILVAWNRLSPKSCAALAIAVASGLIAGEGLMGVVNAVLTLLGVESPFAG